MARKPATPAASEETPNQEEQSPTLPPELASRFVTAVTSDAPSQDQVAIVRQNAGAIAAAAEQLNQLPDSRYKSLALTALEESQMWANKAVFQ
ncbi:hypothetical protein [uncultured Microbacterium sp.]|uniref:Acb2/Tad1 domain-containing protein n=1 Tax=uncultured Microbacterium sp. TaxID=191216 RepID=UPI0028D6D731|nr:hypothetical protein [uncultured Microbacterium sp.]